MIPVGDVDPVEFLSSTTFCGRRFSRDQIREIIATVKLFKNLSRHELALTICEHMKWTTPRGSLKINSALDLLQKFETMGLCLPPAIKSTKRSLRPTSVRIEPSVVSAEIRCEIEQISPVSLKLIDSQAASKRFNEQMASHHYLGYKRAFGAYIRYVIIDKDGRELGLLLFAASAWSLEDRDTWIQWERKHRVKRLNLIISNSRFLVFPWVHVPNLASKALSLVPPRIAEDWFFQYGYRPVLMETFVDQEKYLGTCYQAANWQKVGQTKGRGKFDSKNDREKSIKDIYVYPLVENFRDVLLRGEPRTNKNLTTHEDIRDRLCRIHDNVVKFWTAVAPLIKSIAEGFDTTWQKRRRVIDSMLLVLIIFRLVSTRAKKGYGSTIDEVWENCRNQGLPLPQKKPIAPSAFGDARKKLDENIFKIINSRVIKEYNSFFDCEDFRFHGHRVYAVDGSKINLPRDLIEEGFITPNEKSHYPQGLLSCLYRLKANIPLDFILTKDTNERRVSLTHHSVLDEGDIVVYDRGYFSYEILYAHIKKGLHAVFRLSESTYLPIQDFMASDDLDRIAFIKPVATKSIAKFSKIYPGVAIDPLKIRLIKYRIEDKYYFLGTTLLEQNYPYPEFQDLYHSRWGIEELYKTSKHVMGTEEFHSKNLRGVRQEIYAQFTLITMNRIFTNHTDGTHEAKQKDASLNKKTLSNFKNSIMAFTRNIEALIFGTGQKLYTGLFNLLQTVTKRHQKQRPNRAYPRISHLPKQKWNSAKARKTAKAA